MRVRKLVAAVGAAVLSLGLPSTVAVATGGDPTVSAPATASGIPNYRVQMSGITIDAGDSTSLSVYVAADGGVFTFSSAVFYGSLGDAGVTDVVAFVPTESDRGYWLIRRDKTTVPFGDAA